MPPFEVSVKSGPAHPDPFYFSDSCSRGTAALETDLVVGAAAAPGRDEYALVRKIPQMYL